MLEHQSPEARDKLELLRSLASEAFEQIDQGKGIELSTERQLAGFMRGMGRRAAPTAKRGLSAT